MSPTEQALPYLLDCALHEREPSPERMSGVDWSALYELAQAHKLDGMLLDPVCALPDTLLPPRNVLAAWQEGAMLTMMGQALLVEQLHQLLGAMEVAGIRAVVLKGVALKPLYPQPDLRTMSDADLLVAEAQFGQAVAAMEAQGYTLLETEPGVNVYGGEDGLRVELHARLFDRTAYGFLSRLDEAAMFPIEKTYRAEVYGGEAWVFPPMEHALFMLCHMAKHMITTGFGLRQAADFALFAQAHDEGMDWPAFWSMAETLGLSAFASALLSLGVRYLSLERGNWAQGMAEDSEAADALLMDLLDAGVFGKRTEDRIRSAAVVYRSYDGADGDSGRIRRALFPSATSLKSPYLYARNHPVLLPIAWVHRLLNYAWSLITGKAKHKDTTAGIQVADKRLRLLGQLGLRDKAS